MPAELVMSHAEQEITLGMFLAYDFVGNGSTSSFGNTGEFYACVATLLKGEPNPGAKRIPPA